MKYLFSEKNNSFYPYALIDDYIKIGTWPFDGLEVGEDTFSLYSGSPPIGKMRGSINGQPAWVDLPSPSQRGVNSRS
ncbi:hypothetical protein B4903_21985 [Yersinia frederiksenii]|nr:hypothetical protein B4903_21985 [Yersinia frederiksenii]